MTSGTINGITTSRAHLDPLNFPVVSRGADGQEIDWIKLALWLQTFGADPALPSFAGRYFLGAPTAAEVDAASPFCLWAHGEGWPFVSGADGKPEGPSKIVPLQRADPVRQSTTGYAGAAYGKEDATAIAHQLDLCLAVGDLTMGDAKQILVFLEVADDTELSPDYWSAWASTLREILLWPATAAERLSGVHNFTQPLLPAILCAFPFDTDTQTFLPDPGVHRCLDEPGPNGIRNDCSGFWARRKQGDPALATHGFETWAHIGEYYQPPYGNILDQILGKHRVPVRFLRWFDDPEGWGITDELLLETLGLVTLDWPATGADDPLAAAFTATAWRADAVDPKTAQLTTMPALLGVDAGGALASTPAQVDCLRKTPIVVSALPYDLQAPQTPVNEQGACSFMFRYYHPGRSSLVLTRAEAVALSRADFQIGVVWEGIADFNHGHAAYSTSLAKPFVEAKGRDDGKSAFTYAAETIGQPRYTPIYFGVDFPVNEIYMGGILMPPMDDITQYFIDVRTGFQDYLSAHPGAPYFVGAYGQTDVCQELYRKGLVSHFWQTPWASWGNSGRPFSHANTWQIGLSNDLQSAFRPDNAAILGCADVDVDVSWGDPGGFQVS
jgi:hypothetical protein